MAYITSSSNQSNTSIDAFFGLNMSKTGATNLKLGESPQMTNWRITRDYKLEKMYGYKTKYKHVAPIRAMWMGLLGKAYTEVYVENGIVWLGENVALGSIADDVTRIFEFNQKLYFYNGHELKMWDGTNFEDVTGYVPLIKISTEPNGEGVDYEPINLLTGQKRQRFSPNGTDKDFYIAETDIDSADKVLLDGVELEFTADLKLGKISVTEVIEQGVDSLEIWWTKGQGQRDLILKNHYFQLYGLADDTRVFLYGNPDAKNRIYFSDLADGVPDVTYFPATNFIDIGSSNVAVTDIQRQYDRLIISKEDSTYYAGYEQITDTTGTSIITFPVNPLNKAHGAVAFNQGQVLDNFVTTIDTSIVQWTNTDTKDERNAQIISSKIEQWLNERDLSKAVTMDYQENKEYWLVIEDEIMIYNYENQCYSLLKIPDKITCFVVKDKIYAGTESGKIIEFNEKLTTYDGEIIDAEWQSGYYDFGIEERRKTMRTVWLTLKPWNKTSLEINYISDRDAGSEAKEVESHAFSYENLSYANHTYNTQRSVKPFRIKLKAKKFAFLKLTLRNRKKDEKVTVNSIAIKKAIGGEVK